MQIDIISSEKSKIELTVDNLTIAEALRAYLYEQGVHFAAWRREHPSKPLLFTIEDDHVKKVLGAAVSALKKDCDALAALVKK